MLFSLIQTLRYQFQNFPVLFFFNRETSNDYFCQHGSILLLGVNVTLTILNENGDHVAHPFKKRLIYLANGEFLILIHAIT